ncbi:MAG: hypothetical protein MHM6MM_006630 [Cercozoa sp. M6MM]
MAGPVLKPSKVVRKRTKKFIRHQSDRFLRVDESWRRPKGIDSRVRRRFRSNRLLPSIGFGTDKKSRDVLPCGYRVRVVNNVDEVEGLMMVSNKFAAQIASKVSAKKRQTIIARADALGIKVLNRNAKLREEETN